MARNTFAIIGILAVLLMTLGMVSAAGGVTIDILQDSPITVVPGDTVTLNATVTNNNDTAIIIEWVNTSTIDWVSLEDNSTLAVGESRNYSATLLVPQDFNCSQSSTLRANIYDNSTGDSLNYNSGSFTLNHTASTTCWVDTTDDDDTSTSTSWCAEDFNGEKGDLEIISIDINNKGQGDDDVWEYLDEIEIEVTVENTHDDDSVDDVVIEIEIRDTSDNTYTRKDFDLNEDSENVGRISKDGDEEAFTFVIDELPIDLEEGDYRLYVRAYEDNNEDEQCVSISEDFTDDDETYYEFEIEASDDSTVIVKKNLDNIQASCGDKNVEVKFKVYNVGSDKEEKVLVNLYNAALGIDEYRVIDNLRDGSGKEVVFFINIPTDVSGNTKIFDIYTFYDYDEDGDELDEFAYDEDSNDNGDDFSIGLEILSCKGPQPTIKPNLESAAEVGTELVVKTRITNNGDDNDFVISVEGFESWAELVSISPQVASIKKGEFVEVIVKLMPTTAGPQSFKINTIVDGETYSQAISVGITEKAGIFSGMNQVLIYIIIAIIAILILIFLVLIAKISRRPAKPQF